MSKMHILLFYKFLDFDKLESFQRQYLRECKAIGLKGRILIAKEGINGSVSGNKKQIEEFKKLLTSDPRFEDIVFKEEIGLEHPFRRMSILIRDEVLAMDNRPIDLENNGKYITADELKELYDKGLDKDVIILDTRNDYEYKVGKFKNSIDLGIKTFREFPEAIKKLSDKKDKKIITFCTGGIRCEKATAYMKNLGFEDVYQLKDGILTFGQKFPGTYWEGKCFVFDKRLVSDINKKDEDALCECHTCNEKSDLYRNCRNVKCDLLYTQCKSCQDDFNGCCSKECFKEFQKQCLVKSKLKQNRRMVAQ